MKILKHKYMHENTLNPLSEDFKEWEYFLKKFFTIEDDILTIEFKKDSIVYSIKHFLWFIKRFQINYDVIIRLLMKEYDLSVIEKYNSFELIVPKEINQNETKFIIYKSKHFKIELFLQFLDYINFFKSIK